VKILFDANTPAPLARFLRGHQVERADELDWQGLDNGVLLDAAEEASSIPMAWEFTSRRRPARRSKPARSFS